MSLPLHTTVTAPAESKDELAAAARQYGFLPNLLAVMASSPPLLRAYRAAGALFDTTSLTPIERQVVLLSVSVANACEYCVAAHTVTAGMQKVPASVVEAIRAGTPIADSKLESLRRLTTSVVVARGRVSDAEIDAFLGAGYTRTQILEVIVGVGMKTLSNYMNHLANTPLDSAFAPASWSVAA